MHLEQLPTLIASLKKGTLQNWNSHKKMAPAMRLQFTDKKIADKQPKDASVLILIYPNKKNKLSIALTQRASYNGTHSGQISFPGGKKDKTDKNFIDTALREANEEININPKELSFVKALSKTYIPQSNFWVHPFVFICKKTPDFKLNYEVEQLIELPIRELLNDQNLHIKNLSTSYMKNIDVPCFKFNNHIIWGATAMILSELKDLINLQKL